MAIEWSTDLVDTRGGYGTHRSVQNYVPTNSDYRSAYHDRHYIDYSWSRPQLLLDAMASDKTEEMMLDISFPRVSVGPVSDSGIWSTSSNHILFPRTDIADIISIGAVISIHIAGGLNLGWAGWFKKRRKK